MRHKEGEQTPDPKHDLEQQLIAQYGPLLGGATLHKALGFPTSAALRQAEQRGQVGVHLFVIANRRGRFALTRDVALWLAGCLGDSRFDDKPSRDAVTSVAGALGTRD